MKLKQLFTKVNKTITAGEETLQVQRQELSHLQSQLQDKQTKLSQVSNALNVISASLVIDENDKQALAQKGKAENTIESLKVDIATLEGEIDELNSKISDSEKAVKEAKGESFKQEVVKKRALIQLRKQLAYDINSLYAVENSDWFSWAESYGYEVKNEQVVNFTGATNSYSKKIVNENEVISHLQQMNDEATELAEEKAQELADKIKDFTAQLLKDEGLL
ncbi:hypothetical protein [Priestia flexa]|uniref:hypothetical protein n=1 Tax=Priestia flexa TaxID=86664 RepID=UPI0032EBBE67